MKTILQFELSCKMTNHFNWFTGQNKQFSQSYQNQKNESFNHHSSERMFQKNYRRTRTTTVLLTWWKWLTWMDSRDKFWLTRHELKPKLTIEPLRINNIKQITVYGEKREDWSLIVTNSGGQTIYMWMKTNFHIKGGWVPGLAL